MEPKEDAYVHDQLTKKIKRTAKKIKNLNQNVFKAVFFIRSIARV